MLENSQTQQNLQNVPFTPGQPIAVPTSSFGKDVQEAVIDNYFNNSGSVYAAAVREFNSQFQAPQQNAPQPAPQETATPQLSSEEIAALTNIKNMIDANPQILVDYARASMGASNNQPVQQQAFQPGSNSGQTNNVPKDESSVDMWDTLFGNDQNKQQTNVQQPGQDAVAAQGNQDSGASFIEATRVACLKKGVDYDKMSEWTGEFFTPENLVELYMEVMKASQEVPQQQPQQQQPTQQRAPQPLNLSEAPSPNTVKILAGYNPTSTNNNNPFWR